LTSSNHYTKYLLACITNWLKLQSCSVLIHFVTNSFLIKRDLVNLYVWNTFFSLTLFKKLIQNWFLISFIASWYKFHICTISAHASSFLHLFQICFFDDNVFCISMNSLFYQSFDFAHIHCLNTNNFTVFLMHSVK